jgi:polysaccharide export outer membrane protein
MRFLILLLFFAASCTNTPYKGRDVCGADDFVIDSYQIREGKFAILELEGSCTPCFDEELMDEYADRIQEGDVLSILLYHPTRKDLPEKIASMNHAMGFAVSDKKIFLPGLGSFVVEGMTLSEAKQNLEERVQDQISDVEFFLSYKDRPNQKVDLIGMVEGCSVSVNGSTRLFDVLCQAKISPTANLFKSYLVRDGCMLPVDFVQLIKEGNMCHNVVMRGGDKVFIADGNASPLMILGEVNKQRVIDLPNGYMTLRQALAEAGGIALTGDRRYIQVIRGNIACPKIYTLHWQHVLQLPSQSLLLIPGDIVYVAATPLAEWDRFVNQILPTLIGIDLVTKGAKNVGITLP